MRRRFECDAQYNNVLLISQTDNQPLLDTMTQI